MLRGSFSSQAQTEAGIDPGGIRLSIGLEQSDDVIADLSRALGEI